MVRVPFRDPAIQVAELIEPEVLQSWQEKIYHSSVAVCRPEVDDVGLQQKRPMAGDANVIRHSVYDI